jgi:hypothetical protein
VLAQRVLEAVFGDQAIRRLAQTAKDELDARVEALMSAELLRYHQVLDGLAVQPGQAERLRQAAAAVQAARAEGLPEASAAALERGREEAALPPAEERRSLEPPRVTQVPALGTGQADDIVDAELVESPREEYR